MNPEQAAYSVMLEVVGILKTKDAYDIAFVLHNHPNLALLAGKMAPLISGESSEEAYANLKEYFAAIDSLGPKRAAQFASENGQDYEQTRQAAYQDSQDLFYALSVSLGE